MKTVDNLNRKTFKAYLWMSYCICFMGKIKVKIFFWEIKLKNFLITCVMQFTLELDKAYLS